MAIAVAIGGCGDGAGGPNADAPDADPNAPDADPNAPDADPNAPDANPDDAGFVQLITGTWTANPGTEPYWCARLTVTEDIYITAFRDISPPGTHHTVVTIDPNPTAPDGESSCAASTNEDAMLFASGVGTDDFEFPPGVAVKVPAGAQILLNLHLFNISDQPLAGTSGTLVKTVPVSEVTDLAEAVFAGTFLILIEDNGQPATINGGCTFGTSARLLNIWPHMHQIGTHMTVSHQGTVLHDLPYNFNEQINYPIAAPGYLVGAGERLDVACTYFNPGPGSVMFGDGSEDEMCFAGFYRYPAEDTGLFCTN